MEEKALKNIMVIAGEASGDLHGANLVNAFFKRGAAHFFGIGGPAMEKAGVELIYHIKNLSVMGITEVLSKLPSIFKALRTAKKALKERQPALLILIDFPDFNLKAAKAAKKNGVPVLYYISPKIWAWRSGRARKLKQLVTQMAIILPFEQTFFEQYDIPVTYVGNPLLDTSLADGCQTQPGIRENSEERVVGLLPGSRVSEVTGLLPVMLEAAVALYKRNSSYRFLVSLAPSIDAQLVADIVAPFREKIAVEIMEGEIRLVFEKADFLIAASGTVTLEAAIFGIPMVVIYKTSAFSHFVAKMLIEVDHVSLVNLIAEKQVVPELIQDMANAETLSDTVSEIMDNPECMNQMKSDLQAVRDALGGPGASERVSDIALGMINK